MPQDAHARESLRIELPSGPGQIGAVPGHHHAERGQAGDFPTRLLLKQLANRLDERAEPLLADDARDPQDDNLAVARRARAVRGSSSYSVLLRAAFPPSSRVARRRTTRNTFLLPHPEDVAPERDAPPRRRVHRPVDAAREKPHALARDAHLAQVLGGGVRRRRHDVAAAVKPGEHLS